MVVLRSVIAGHVVAVRTGVEIASANTPAIRTLRILRTGRGGAIRIAAQMYDNSHHHLKTVQNQ